MCMPPRLPLEHASETARGVAAASPRAAWDRWATPRASPTKGHHGARPRVPPQASEERYDVITRLCCTAFRVRGAGRAAPSRRSCELERSAAWGKPAAGWRDGGRRELLQLASAAARSRGDVPYVLGTPRRCRSRSCPWWTRTGSGSSRSRASTARGRRTGRPHSAHGEEPACRRMRCAALLPRRRGSSL